MNVRTSAALMVGVILWLPQLATRADTFISLNWHYQVSGQAWSSISPDGLAAELSAYGRGGYELYSGVGTLWSDPFMANAGDTLTFEGYRHFLYEPYLTAASASCTVGDFSVPWTLPVYQPFTYTVPSTGTYSFSLSASAGGFPSNSTPRADAWAETGVRNVRLLPEPSTLALLGIGAASLLAYAWRRWRRVRAAA